MRNIGDVIDQLLAVEGVPAVTDTGVHFQPCLNSIMDSVRYTPPEAIGLRWQTLSELVSGAVGSKTYEELVGWELEIVNILIDKK